MKKSIFAIVFLLFAFNTSGQDQSVKDRWNVKFGVAPQKTHNIVPPLFFINNDSDYNARQPNFRLEANYGVLNWLEAGIYIGLFSYKYVPVEVWMSENGDIFSGQKRAHAPSFGVNVNIHILPFFAANQNSRWEFYIPVRFGGMYLTKWDKDKHVIYSFPTSNRWDFVGERPNYDKKLRHEFGVGLGGAYYITNAFGFYMEALVGQFSYAPEMFRSPYAIRAGLTVRL